MYGRAEPADPEVLAEGETMELPLIVVDVAEEKNIGRTKTKEEVIRARQTLFGYIK
ncbi:MAG: hypothetical protein ACOCVY_01860 [Patescibacteria group bacterium]